MKFENGDRVMTFQEWVELSTEPTSQLIITAIHEQKRKCLCCGKRFKVYPYVIQDFCDACFPIVCKAVFDKSNENLTCKQLVDKVRKEIKENDK